MQREHSREIEKKSSPVRVTDNSGYGIMEKDRVCEGCDEPWDKILGEAGRQRTDRLLDSREL